MGVRLVQVNQFVWLEGTEERWYAWRWN